MPEARVVIGTSESIPGQFVRAKERRRALAGRADEAGNYVVRGVAFEQEWRLWVDKDEYAPVLTRPFALYADRPQPRIDVTLEAGSTVAGRVIDPSGAPVAEAGLACIPVYSSFLAPMTEARTARKTVSGEDGRFAFRGVPAGDYQVLAACRGYRLGLKGTPIFPDGASDILDVRVVLHPVNEGGGVIFGTVADENGEPLAGAHLALAALDPGAMDFGGLETTSSRAAPSS